MLYEKQNFIDGQILTARHLNHIENGFGELEKYISSLSGLLIVRLSQDRNIASSTAKEINNHILNGGCTMLYTGYGYWPLTSCDADYAIFTNVLTTGEIFSYYIDADGNCTFEETNYASDVLPTLIITVDTDTLLASDSSATVERHVASGGRVILSIDNNLIPLTYLDDFPCAYFETYDVDTNTKVSYLLWDDSTVEVRRVQFGDIETALDAIIEIQNQLTGGDA